MEVPRNVYIEVEKPVFTPESLLVPCEPDPKLTGTVVSNEQATLQSLERKARLERCSKKLDNIKEYNDTLRENYEEATQQP